jgi:hypothetical protein
MFEITIEFLRRGPAHNQLLSPLTEYLVLCGNRPAQSFHVPCEHYELLAHLASLRYQDEGEVTPAADREPLRPADEARALHLKQVRQLLTTIVDGICGLEAEVINAAGDWVQLRLVLGPAELGLLPFELASSPGNFAGSDLPLVLNAQRPIVVTREVRQNRSRAFPWCKAPKILVVTTDFPDAPVPVRAHLAGIRQALDPWVHRTKDGKMKSDDLWKVVERASLEKILEECRRDSYTHVHILAHGAALSDRANRGYGIVLHAASGNGKEIVEGERLATALCQPETCGLPGRPYVVVLASCDSGAGPDVVYSGAGVAQVLHTSGIPFVLASQFPLSSVGSAAMVADLYPRILRGEDPRKAIYYVRQQLRSSLPSTHDWASLVAYSSLPEDLPRQLIGIRLKRMQQMLNAARGWYDPAEVEDKEIPGQAALVAAARPKHEEHPVAQSEGCKDVWLKQIVEVEGLLSCLAREVASSKAEEHFQSYSEVCGLLARIWKGESHVAWLGNDRKRSFELLQKAYDWYERCHEHKLTHGEWREWHWNATQYLCLCAVRHGHLIGKDAHWLRARASAMSDWYSPNPNDAIWAGASMAELWMLRPLTTSHPPEGHWQKAHDEAIRMLSDFLRREERLPVLLCVRRHFMRYKTWWREVQKAPDFRKTLKIADELVSLVDSKIANRAE